MRHKLVNPKADGTDATITRPSDWNDDHIAPFLTSNPTPVADAVLVYGFKSGTTPNQIQELRAIFPNGQVVNIATNPLLA